MVQSKNLTGQANKKREILKNVPKSIHIGS